MPGANPYIDIEVGGLQRRVSDISGLMCRSARLEVPGDFPIQGMQKAEVDLQIIGARLRDNAEDMRALLQAFVTGQNSEVQRLISELGLTERDFQGQGGGIFWAIVIVGVLCCASEAY